VSAADLPTDVDLAELERQAALKRIFGAELAGEEE
jgi:hypothetical protein